MLHLRRTNSDTIPIETDGLTPDRLAKLSLNDVELIPVRHGNRVSKLGEFFNVTGDAADGEVHIEGDCRHVTRLAAGMGGGRLTIDGFAGTYLGARMTGGTIEL